jgi:hypothetical protein
MRRVRRPLLLPEGGGVRRARRPGARRPLKYSPTKPGALQQRNQLVRPERVEWRVKFLVLGRQIPMMWLPPSTLGCFSTRLCLSDIIGRSPGLLTRAQCTEDAQAINASRTTHEN